MGLSGFGSPCAGGLYGFSLDLGCERALRLGRGVPRAGALGARPLISRLGRCSEASVLAAPLESSSSVPPQAVPRKAQSPITAMTTVFRSRGELLFTTSLLPGLNS